MKRFVQMFENTAGQISSDEVLKVLAGIAGAVLIGIFFLTPLIPESKGSYVMMVEGALWGYVFAQGAVGNVTKQ